MYSKEKVNEVLETYHKCGDVKETMRLCKMSDPTTIYRWIKMEKEGKEIGKTHGYKKHPCDRLSFKEKYEAVRRCLYEGESVKEVADSLGVSLSTIYTWIYKYKDDKLQ